MTLIDYTERRPKGDARGPKGGAKDPELDRWPHGGGGLPLPYKYPKGPRPGGSEPNNGGPEVLLKRPHKGS